MSPSGQKEVYREQDLVLSAFSKIVSFPFNEEKIIMILDSLKKKDIEEGVRHLELAVDTSSLCDTLKGCSKTLLKKGLSQ